MSLSDVGNLMCLPFDEIEPGDPTDAHEYLIQAAANLLGSEGRNWIPLIVQEIGLEQYRVVGNAFVYAVAAAADLKEVWCIIADNSPDTVTSTKALSREMIPQTNLSIASRDEIAAALDYLIRQPNSPLKGVNLATAVARMDAAPRQYWETLQPITKLGCRITAGKKLKALERIFCLTPAPMPDVIRDRSLLESFNAKQLRDVAKKRQVKGYSKMSKPELVEVLIAA